MPEIKISIVGSSASCQEPAYPSSQAFNGITAPQSWWQTLAHHQSNEWVAGHLSSGQAVNKIRYYACALTSKNIKHAKFEGSNDGSNWTKIGNDFSFNSSEGWQEVTFNNDTAYTRYRLFCYDSYKEISPKVYTPDYSMGWHQVTLDRRHFKTQNTPVSEIHVGGFIVVGSPDPNNHPHYTVVSVWLDSYNHTIIKVKETIHSYNPHAVSLYHFYSPPDYSQIHMAVAELEFYYDDKKPQITSFAINSGASSTKNRVVTLNNVCIEEPTHYMASEDPDFVLSKIWQGNHDLADDNKVQDFDAGSSVDWELFKLTTQNPADVQFRSKSAATQAGLDGASYGDWQSGVNGNITAPDNRWLRVEIKDTQGWTTLGGFNYPCSIYYDSASGYIYVTDYNNHRIIKTKIDGTGWVTYGSEGSGIGQFRYPHGIHYDSASEFIYVVDNNNHRIIKTKIDGTGWTTLGGFQNPHGIYYDLASEYIYVADLGNHRIVKTKIDGTGWVTYGSQGSGIGQFRYPKGIYYDSASGYIYVTDGCNHPILHRIVKTKIDGTGWTTYGSKGSGIGQFNYPYGIRYDSASGFIYIADASNNRIVKTKIDGTGWTTYGSPGSDEGQFIYPYDICYDSASGFIYVTDKNNHRIVKCKPSWS